MLLPTKFVVVLFSVLMILEARPAQASLLFDRDGCPEEFRCEKDGILNHHKWTMSRLIQGEGCTTECKFAPRIRKSHGGWVCGGCDQVYPTDTKLVRPNDDGPIIATIAGYNWRNTEVWADDKYELPIYKNLDRDLPDVWNSVLDELLLSRVDVVLWHGRGCWEKDPDNLDYKSALRGTGDMCPRRLKRFVDAVERAGVDDVIRVGMWDETESYQLARMTILKTVDQKFDVSDESNWTFFWDYNIKIWFDTIPSKLWFRINSKPIIAFGHLRYSAFKNQQGNASRLLAWLKTKFQEAYGVQPFIILDKSWFAVDTTIGTAQADGKHGWVNLDFVSTPYTYFDYDGGKWGCVVPGFREPETPPGCGVGCREVRREDGQTLKDGLEAGLDATFIMVEGWNNMVQSSGLYRSLDWTYPTQYINIVREFADPEPETLLFQAEGSDQFSDTTPVNLGGQYADRALDVGALGDGTGWYVGWTEAGEWLEYQNVKLGCGIYRFTAKAARSVANDQSLLKIRLAFESLSSVALRGINTDNENYELVHLGQVLITAPGVYNLRIEFETGGVNLDWFFLKRISSSC